jgi:SAM-dependent methyltransferase
MRVDHLIFRMQNWLGPSLTLLAIHFLASLRPFVGLPSNGSWEEKVWLARQIPDGPASILDIGGSESITRMLLPPSCTVMSLDVRFLKGIDSPKAIIGDATKMPFRDDTFDYVLLSSTIEHIGMGIYGDPEDNQGDVIAVREARRVVRPNGYLILTTPYSTPGGSTWYRFYSDSMLTKLLAGFRILKKEYLLKDKTFRQVWNLVYLNQLPFIPAAEPLQSIVCVIAEKQTGL